MKNKKGFSLPELLVVIAIIGVLAGYVIMRISGNRYDIELTSAGNITQSAIIKARDMARAPQQGGNLSDSRVVNGYGVQLPLVDAADIAYSTFRDTVDNTSPANQNKFSTGDVNVSTINLKDSDISNIKVLKYIYYDINNVMSEDTDTAKTRDIVFDSKEVPTNESVFYNQNNAFTKVGISLQHIITKKEIRVWIYANGDISTEEYKPVFYTLTININGTGTTSVASGTTFEQGKSAIVTATASGGYSFGGWSGCNSVSGTQCTVVMGSNKTITVTFNPPPPPPYCGDGTCNNGETWQTCLDCPIPITVSSTQIGYNTFTATFTSADGGNIKVVSYDSRGGYTNWPGATFSSGSRVTFSPVGVCAATTCSYNDVRFFVYGSNGQYSGGIFPGDFNRNYSCDISNVCSGNDGHGSSDPIIIINNVQVSWNIVLTVN